MQRWRPAHPGPWTTPDRYDEDRVLDLELRLDPPEALALLWERALADRRAEIAGTPALPAEDDEIVVGGAFVRREPDRLVLTSAGEDALDSLDDLADRLVDAAAAAGVHARAIWRELPPRAP